MTRIELAELDPRTADGGQGRRLAGSSVVIARPSPNDPELWLISGSGKVGDMEVHVRPKQPIQRLLFLVGYAQDPSDWRDETVSLPAAADLVPAFAQALWRQADGPSSTSRTSRPAERRTGPETNDPMPGRGSHERELMRDIRL